MIIKLFQKRSKERFFYMARNSTIWQLKSTEGCSLGHLIGTIHLQAAAALHRQLLIDEIIMDSEFVYNETNLETMSDPHFQSKLFLPKGDHIRNYFTKSYYQRLYQKLLRSLQLDINKLGTLYPLMIQNIVSQALVERSGYISLDEYIYQQSKSNGKVVCGLETHQEQLKVLQTIDITDQIRFLKHTIENLTKSRIQIQKLSRLFVDGNIHLLYRKSAQQLGKYRSLLLYDRNEVIANRISFTANSDYQQLYSVGAGHLSGKYGLLHLLHQKGFRLSPVN